MGRTAFFLSHSTTVAFIWFTSAALFFFLFQMALHNSTSASSSSSSSDSLISNSELRSRLYNKMEKDLDEKGALFLKDGETSQSLSLSDIFTVKDGSPANPPVRANVLYLSTEYSVPISEAVKSIFNPYFDKAIWFQNSSLYHFSMFHASHHITPIEAEAAAVKSATEHMCRLKIVLDRVVLTSTGVLLGCWQVISGTDPVTIRAKLRAALPHAPEKQLYDPAILHTSFARLLGHPKLPGSLHSSSDELQLFHELVARLNKQLHGFEAMVSELWYVEEYDVLALALNGRMKIHKFQLGCSSS
ncbi:hypothetical protein SDJN02_15235, partial [Cucurbita argyrosperma subsp. argyrosperma]